MYLDYNLSGQLVPTRGVWGIEGGPIPRFGGLIHPIRTPQALWSEVSLWVGDCKNATAYQIWRW